MKAKSKAVMDKDARRRMTTRARWSCVLPLSSMTMNEVETLKTDLESRNPSE